MFTVYGTVVYVRNLFCREEVRTSGVASDIVALVFLRRLRHGHVLQVGSDG